MNIRNIFKFKNFLLVTIFVGFMGTPIFTGATSHPTFHVNPPKNVGTVMASGGSGVGITPGGVYKVIYPLGNYDGIPTVYVNNIPQTTVDFTPNTNRVDFRLAPYFPTNTSLTMKVVTSTGKISFPVTFATGSQDGALYGCLNPNPPFSPTADPDIYEKVSNIQVGRCPTGSSDSLTIGSDVIFHGNAFKAGTTVSDISLSTSGVDLPVLDLVSDTNDYKWKITVNVPPAVNPGTQQVVMNVNDQTYLFIVNFVIPPCAPPPSGDWTVNISCTFTGTSIAPASVIVSPGKLLTLHTGSNLLVDFKQHKLLVSETAGVLVKDGATLRQVVSSD